MNAISTPLHNQKNDMIYFKKIYTLTHSRYQYLVLTTNYAIKVISSNLQSNTPKNSEVFAFNS